MAGTQVDIKKTRLRKSLLVEFEREFRKSVKPQDDASVVRITAASSKPSGCLNARKRNICVMEPFEDLKSSYGKSKILERSSRMPLLCDKKINGSVLKIASPPSQSSDEDEIPFSESCQSDPFLSKTKKYGNDAAAKRDSAHPRVNYSESEPGLSSGSSKKFASGMQTKHYLSSEDSIKNSCEESDSAENEKDVLQNYCYSKLYSSHEESSKKPEPVRRRPKNRKSEPAPRNNVIVEKLSRKSLKRHSFEDPRIFPMPSPIVAKRLSFTCADDDSI